MKLMVIRSVMFDTTVYGKTLESDDEKERDYSYNCIKLVEQGIVTLGSTQLISSEITDTPVEKVKGELIELYQKLNKIELTVDENTTSLANKYLEKLDLTRVDALLIAICSKNKIDGLISWNRRHLTNDHTQKVVKRINDEKGFKTPLILTPKQLIDEGTYTPSSRGVLFVAK